MSFKLSPISVLIITCFTYTYARASIVRSDIPYQTYRDFGENKGIFIPGATDLPIYDKNGSLIGRLDKAPMADFSSASRDGVGTLVAPQYAGSVKHNKGYGSLQFGGTGNNPDYLRHTYQMVDRNEHSNLDYHTPRYSKYVTEVAPANIAGLSRDAYLDTQRFPVRYRTGSGTQFIRAEGSWNAQFLANPYSYLTGGTVSHLWKPAYMQEVRANSGLLYGLESQNSPLTSYAGAGDSGSPLYAWDTQTSRWILVGFQMGGWANSATQANNETNWVVYQTAFNNNLYNEDTNPEVKNTANLTWLKNSDNKTALFTQADKSWTLHIKDENANDTYSGGYNHAMNAGKNITLNGSGGTISLKDSINQGAGGLTFNNDYTVVPENNQTWQGAGLIIAKNKTVTWKVNGIADDFLHKIGEGTLKIEAKGKNSGSLSAGDGITILAQQADEKGEIQAFDKVRLASGRPTVVLTDAKQVNPDNIYFGYRGGRLDVNGNDLTFERIRNVDNGAQIVNHNAEKAANIRVVGDTSYTVYNWENSRVGTVGTIYHYPGRVNGEIWYYRLKTRNYGYFPSKTSNNSWEYLGTDKDKAVKIYLDTKNKVMYQGVLGETDLSKTNGKLNFSYTAPTASSIYTLSGGSNLNGEIKVEKGTLLLSGRPTPHANNLIVEDDWISAYFKANTFKATAGATLQLGNYANLEGDLVAENDSKINLGYSKGENGWDNSWQCVRSDASGVVSCNQNILSDTLYNVLPYAQVRGNITLADNARLNLGKVHYQGDIQGATNSSTTLQKDATWTLNGNSTLGSLNTASGSVVKLNGNTTNGNFNILTVNGNLTGDGRFELSSTFADMQSDKVVVNGLASGNYVLALQDSGKAPLEKVNALPLLTLNNTAQDWSKVQANLLNGHLDLGAFRYQLAQRDNSFVLYNALIPELIAQEKTEAEAAEQARLAAEAKAAAEAAEQVRLAVEAKAAAEAAEQARLVVEAKAAAEAAEQARLAVEAKAAAEAAEQARLAAEAKAAAEAAEQARLVVEAKAAAEAAEQARLAAEAKAAAEVLIQQETKQRDWISQNANTALSDYAAKVNLLTKQQTLLNQYLRRLNADNSGVWLNVDREQMNYNSNDYRTYKQQLFTQQLGADTALAFNGGDWLLGAAFTHSSANNQFAEKQNGKTTNHGVSLYNKVAFDNLFYISTLLNYNRLSSKLSDTEIKQNVWTSSLGFGKRWQLGSVGIEPSFDVSYYRLSAVDYSLNSTAIRADALNFWQTRSGLMLDKTFGFENGGVKLYTALHYVKNLNTKQKLYSNGYAFSAALFQNRIESELGAVFGLGKHFSLTVKGGYAHGDTIKSQFNGGAELKYRW